MNEVASSRGILEGIRVIEYSAFVAAPFAGAMLAGLGADVIRIEQLGGGVDARRWPLHDGRSLYRAGLDSGKRSVALDLRSPRGRQLVAALVAAPGEDSGIFVTNITLPPELTYPELLKAREDVIVIELSGTRPGNIAVDYTVAAGVGFPLITGPCSTEGPVNAVLPAFDLLAGLHIALGIVSAIRRRSKTGEGTFVQLALMDVAVKVADHLGFLEEARLIEEPRPRVGNSIYGTYGRDFVTRDGHSVMVCALTPRQWENLARATDLTDAFKLIGERHRVDLSDEASRFEYHDEIDRLLETWIRERSLAEVAETFERGHVLWGPYRTFKELIFEDDSASNPSASALRFSGFSQLNRLDSPTIGADTSGVLKDVLGLDDDTIRSLHDDGVLC